MTQLFFGIPLRARKASADWGLVERNLRRTVRCLLAQKGVDVKIVIAGHDRPKLLAPYVETGQVTFVDVSRRLPVPDDVEGFNKDKKFKKNWLGYTIGKMTDQPFYYMHMDADDLVHRRFAQVILKSDNKQGYLIRRGYMVDVANRMIARADETTTPFYQHCGSCAVVYFRPDEMPQRPTQFISNFSKYRNHRRYVDVALEQGKVLRRLPRYMGAYLVNHGENNRLYRGLGSTKTAFVERNEITDPEAVSLIVRGFPGLARIMETPKT